MFTEILKIIPKIDAATLASMERTLNGRFMKVAKRFGSGLVNILKGGGIAAAALGLIDKILNPLKAIQDAMDKTLKDSDDIVTNAEQFGSNAGELFKLQKFAQAKGLDADTLFQLLTKFQGAVAEAAADPTKQTSVRAFAGETNMVAAFFEFIQSLNKMERGQQVLVQQEVFGEKQTLKMADFLRTDFQALAKQLGVKDAAAYQPGLEKLAGLNDLADAKRVQLEMNDMIKKSSIINEGMVQAKSAADKAALDRENANIQNYKNIQAISISMEKIMGLVDQGLHKIGSILNLLNQIVTGGMPALQAIASSRWVKNLIGIGRDGSK